MKKLLLMRHAKSSWANPGTGDHDRVLNRRGREAAPAMGRYMAKAGLIPGHVWCSTAQRARETLARWCEASGSDPEVHFSRDLYMTSPDGIMATARQTPDSHDVCMIVGHNPGFHQTALNLAGQSPPVELIMNFPTAAVAVIRFDVPKWQDISATNSVMEEFLTPRSLPQ